MKEISVVFLWICCGRAAFLNSCASLRVVCFCRSAHRHLNTIYSQDLTDTHQRTQLHNITLTALSVCFFQI